MPFFQPLIDLASAADRRLRGARALALARRVGARRRSVHRGRRTDRSHRPADAEHHGAGDEASRDWPAHLKLAVNVSPVQFRDPTLAEQILKLLSSTGFPANRLEIEITEASLLEDRDAGADDHGEPEECRRPHLARRFRHRLCEPGAGQQPAARPDQDRQELHHDDGQERAHGGNRRPPSRRSATPSTCRSAPRASNPSKSARAREFGCSEAQGWLFGRAVSADAVRTFLRMSDAGISPEEGHAAAPSKLRRKG